MSRSNITNPKLNMRPIFCDVCGSKFPIKDVRKVTDKYNRRFGLILCKPCFAVNKTNAQDRPFTVQEKLLHNTDLVRPDAVATYAVNADDNRLPGKPVEGWANIDPLTNKVNLSWLPPQDQGSSLITGYKIRRASPQLSFHVTIESNTANGAGYYLDSTAAIASEYSYTVAAINGFGEGPQSDYIFWPTDLTIYEDIEYITDGDGNTLLAGDGYFLRSNRTNQGVI